jgi:hypothetical protein
MIVKHFYSNEWQLRGDWKNTDYVFGAPDSDMRVEQNKKSIAASLEISDDEEGMEEIENKGLSLSSHGHIQNVQASPWRAKRADR